MIYWSCERLVWVVSVRIFAVWFLYFLGYRLSRVPVADVNRKVTLCTSSSHIKFLYIYHLIADFIATIIVYKIKDVCVCDRHNLSTIKRGPWNVGSSFGMIASCRRGTMLAQWSRCCVLQIGRSLVRSQLVSLEFFIDMKTFRSHYGPGVDSVSSINVYQEHFLGVKAASV